MQIIATQKFVRTSPQKVRQVVRLVKKMKPADAIATLPHVGRRAALPLAKVLKSAIANAKQKGVSEAELKIKEIQIGAGPTIKRGRTASRGRWHKILKRMSHIRVVLEAEESKKPRKQVRSPQRAKSVRGDRSGKESLPHRSKGKKKMRFENSKLEVDWKMKIGNWLIVTEGRLYGTKD